MASPIPLDITVVPEPLPSPVPPVQPKQWFPWLKMGLNLPNPGRYDEFAREAQEITTTQEYFDGMKFDFARGLSEHFIVQHSLHMGSSEVNGAGTYSFTPTVLSKSKRTTFVGRFDGDGRVLGRIHHAISQKFNFLAHAQVSAEQSMMSMEASYSGSDWTGTLKLEGPNVVEATMMQSILPKVGLGMQLIHLPQPHGAITGMSAVLRVLGGPEILKPLTQQRVPRWVASLNSGSMSPFHASFTWHTPTKADFATELALQPRQDGSLESVWCAGALYEFNSGRIKARVDSNWRVGVFIEEGVSQNIRAFLCGDLDHKHNKYKFGFGITIQS